ncbi:MULTISPECIES: flagellar assembly protein FliW [Bacillales]|jgi:flagellar assembly factor FliW|uniref:flagellar assembly protein FliW n=1 Tax=Brevibacillus TaxID=55080 RepID=UPI00149248BE|nr:MULTISPECIES: flagellar assembly protein FliW [Bacillales]MDT3417900.1 flagellar assembly factor FliW [Brevibacillus aydinogluensis]NNV01354.1 flagellar assembly protein FliW [Brevibacillus sp. MCWH]UFJ61950.1 flagellar assembly protein FliW [Anoxybacillus sediminis]
MMTGGKFEIGKVFFEEGLPGFLQLQFFKLVQEEEGTPFYLLQSTEDEKVGFWLINPFVFFADYQFRLPEQSRELLRLSDEGQVMVFNIITPSEKGITVNLKAPIVINKENRMAKQVILEEDYDIRHPLVLKHTAPGGV